MIAAIKVRGEIDAGRKVSKTFETLSLEKKHQLVLVEDNDSMRGMLNKVKDYIAYGDISDETLEALEEETGRDLEAGDTVSLTPPSGGFRSTKENFEAGGSLGDHKNLDELVKNMM